MIDKIAFTVYPVRDAKRARAFYEDTLELVVGQTSASNAWTEYDLPGGGCLALFETADQTPSMDSGGTIALEVRDLDALVARLAAAGVALKGEFDTKVCRMKVIEDSEGNALILHQLKQAH